ncbi:MAG: hypothetical protein JWO15_3045 [Sphingomonadales bacterium]|nr:hypothetical protein [Sphingomonadales bacterium]
MNLDLFRVQMVKKTMLLASATMIVVPTIPIIAFAQAAVPPEASAPAGDGSDAHPDIVVTAQHRSENLQSVPMSISALTGASLEQQGAKGFEDYLRQVPGVSFVPQGPGLGQLNIRGVQTQPVGRDQPGVKPSVGVYLDETPIAIGVFNPDLDIYDMNRVEVLRGPQGTLFGSGSLAGTIRFITNKPDDTKFSGSAEVGGSQIEKGGTSYDAKGMLNVPIGEGAAIRIVGYENHYGGYIDQVPVTYGGQTYGISKDNANSADKWGVRTELGFKTGNLNAVLSYVHQKITANGYPLNDIINPNIPAVNFVAPYPVPVSVGKDQQFRQTPESRSDQIDLFSANLDYDLGFGSLTSVSSYTRRNLHDARDYSTQIASFGTVFAAPASLIDAQNISAFSQELRLVSKSAGPFTWSTGVFYSDVQRRYNQLIYQAGSDAQLGSSVALGAGGPDRPYDSIISVHLHEYAAYGEAKYMLTEKLGITAGLRGFKYSEANDSAFRGVFGSNNGVSVERHSSASGISPRGILTYQADKNMLLSAQISRGFRPGSSNDVLPGVCQQTAPSQYNPETLTNYELAAKTRFLNGAVTFNAAAYDIEYRQLQLSARLTCGFSFITNGSSARTRGVELELTVHPVSNLTIGINGTYQDPKLTSNLPAAAAAVLPGVGEGSRLPGSPKHTLNASIEYSIPYLFGDMAGYFGGNIQNVGGIKTYIEDPDTLNTSSYTLASLRVGVRNEKWDVSLNVENIGNTAAQLSLERETGGRFSFVRNIPRSFGVTARTHF